MATAFISGHLDLAIEDFIIHYAPLIDLAIERGDNFIMGDAKGTDYISQEYLVNRVEKDRITVCHMFSSPRNLSKGITQLVGSFTSDNKKDTYMTNNSDYDIAYIKPGREKSGTAKNIDRQYRL